jgi:hypothetical protein
MVATAALRPILPDLIDRGERQQIPTVPLMATLSTTPTPRRILPAPRRGARRIGTRRLGAITRGATQTPLQLRDPLILPGYPQSQHPDLRIPYAEAPRRPPPGQRHRPPPPHHAPHRDTRHPDAMSPTPTERLQVFAFQGARKVPMRFRFCRWARHMCSLFSAWSRQDQGLAAYRAAAQRRSDPVLYRAGWPTLPFGSVRPPSCTASANRAT